MNLYDLTPDNPLEKQINSFQKIAIDQLLMRANISIKEAEYISGQVDDLTQDEADRLIQYLTENQIDDDISMNGGQANITSINRSVMRSVEDPNK